MLKMEKMILNKAKKAQKTIIFPEAAFSDRIIKACKYLQKKKIVKVVLVGDENALKLRYKNLNDFTILNPKTSPYSEELAEELYLLRKEKGMKAEEAKELIQKPFYFSSMLLKKGIVDGIVGGAETATADVLRPALQIIKAKNEGGLVSSCFAFLGKHKLLTDRGGFMIFADCATVVNPTTEQLAEIGSAAIETSRLFSSNAAKVAYLSFSTKGSAKCEFAEKMQKSSELCAKLNPTAIVDGEMQFDAAIIPSVAMAKFPNSKLKGDANIFIFPDLNSGNICYKAVQRFGGLKAIGPIMQNFAKPVNDLSRGCTVSEIVLVSAITALQAENQTE